MPEDQINFSKCRLPPYNQDPIHPYPPRLGSPTIEVCENPRRIEEYESDTSISGLFPLYLPPSPIQAPIHHKNHSTKDDVSVGEFHEGSRGHVGSWNPCAARLEIAHELSLSTGSLSLGWSFFLELLVMAQSPITQCASSWWAKTANL